MRILLFCFILLFLACNNPRNQQSSGVSVPKIEDLKVPANCKILNRYLVSIPFNNETGESGQLIIAQVEDSSYKTDTIYIHYKNIWLLKTSSGKSFYGSSALLRHSIPNEGDEGDLYFLYNLSFNDTNRNYKEDDNFIIGTDTFNIFPPGIDTILPSQDGKYLALIVDQVEAAPTIDIIDLSTLLKTGHYKVVKTINPYPGDISKLVMWKGDKLIMESDYSLTALNKKVQLDDSDDKSDSARENYSYDVEKKVFAEYKGK